MENELPEGWVEVTFGVIGEIVTGNTPSKAFPEYYNGGTIPWVKPGDINKNVEIVNTEDYLTESGAGKARLIPAGSVMITCIGNLGNVAIAGVEVATNQQINSVVIKRKFIDQKYLYYYALTLKPWLSANSTSTTISMVNKSNFEKAPFPLPPLAEQTRIVAKLDQAFAHVDTLKTSLSRIPELLRKFRQTVLTKAVTGKLTEDINKGEKYSFTELEKFCESSFYGPRFSNDEYNIDGIPTVRTTDMNDNGQIEITQRTPRVLVPAEKIANFRVNKGDLLITRTGSIGKMAIFESELLAIPSAYLIRFRFKENVSTKFIFYCLTSPYGQRIMGLEATAITQANLNANKIRSIEVPDIELEEQQEIVKRVEALFATADALDAQYQRLKAQIDKLPQALLAKAFRGELVPQDPQDEPASALLARIKAATATVEKGKKSQKSGQTALPFMAG